MGVFKQFWRNCVLIGFKKKTFFSVSVSMKIIQKLKFFFVLQKSFTKRIKQLMSDDFILFFVWTDRIKTGGF